MASIAQPAATPYEYKIPFVIGASAARHGDRVVRLLHLRRRWPRSWRVFFPAGQPHRVAPGSAGRLRRRLRGPAVRRARVRPHRRPGRAEVRVPADASRSWAASTVVIGLLPGVRADRHRSRRSLLVTLRLLQGLALGGEYGGAAIYVAEHAPDDKRGFYTSLDPDHRDARPVRCRWRDSGVTRSRLSDADFKAWGWRIPFLLSAILRAIVALHPHARCANRRSSARSRRRARLDRADRATALATRRTGELILLVLFGATAGQAVVWYTGQFYALFFLQTELKVDVRRTRTSSCAIALLLGDAVLRVFGCAVRPHRPQEDHHGRLPARRAHLLADLPADARSRPTAPDPTARRLAAQPELLA